jgi:hypothetical protein
MGVAINWSDFEYVWPREPLVAELALLLTASDVGRRTEQLFAEAFGPRALRVLEAVRTEDEVRKLVGEVLDAFHVLPTGSGGAPYFAARSGRRLGPPLDAWTFSVIFHGYIERLRESGYFEEAAPSSWRLGIEGGAQLDYLLQRRLGVGPIWTQFTDSWDDAWDEALLFSVIEVFDELISRPRLTLVAGPERRFRDFGRETGRALFRAWVNSQLNGSSLPYRMAERGEDAGRIVTARSSEDDEYLEEQAATDHHGVGDEVRHAISLARDREATRESKRSAVNVLARILEERRALLKAELFSKDEAALFTIANEYDVRHSNARQRDDYDEAFLDWTFRWYLATIELSDQLIERTS